MKTTFLCAMLTVGTVAIGQQLPQPSPLGKVEQIVGLTTVKVEYSRPSARGRVVFGDLVPYDKLWRTGANGCTRISFDGPMEFGGTQVPAGTYALFTTPGKDTWSVVLNTDTSLGGTSGFDPAKNVAEAKVAPKSSTAMIESFTIGFDAIKDDAATLQLAWEKVVVEVGLRADARARSLENIKVAIASPDAKAGTYHRCARFYLDRGIDSKQALEWAQKADAMEQRYWMKHTLALCYAANQQRTEALQAAKESMDMAAKEGDAAYVKMNEEKIKEWSK